MHTNEILEHLEVGMEVQTAVRLSHEPEEGTDTIFPILVAEKGEAVTISKIFGHTHTYPLEIKSSITNDSIQVELSELLLEDIVVQQTALDL